jgi:uncharacterized protein (DUF1684 family)
MSAVMLTNVNAIAVGNDDAWRKEITDWRTARLERLKSPYGWPSLIGLEWLKEGVNKVGSASDNDIVIAKAPAHLGTVTLQSGKATIALDAKADATIDGEKKATAPLVDDSQPKPTQIGFGTVRFYLIQRGDKTGLRIKDSDAATRQKMVAQGVENFEADPSWRFEAKWEAYNPPHEVEGVNIIGQTEKYQIMGKAVFTRDGKTFSVEPMLENPGDTELFLVFADRTSGKETYGAARFVYTPMPKDGKVVLDFNKAYNPPCAFTPYATCPLPTPENRLNLRVTAGEKKWKGGHDG